MQQNEQPPQPLSTSEVAQVLGVEVRTVHRMVTAGRLKAIGKLPGRTGAYLFDVDEIERHRAKGEPAGAVRSA